MLASRKVAGFEDLAAKLDQAVTSITAVTDSLASGAAKQDIGRIVTSTANILSEVEQGRGFAHRFFYDRGLRRGVRGAAQRTRAAS